MLPAAEGGQRPRVPDCNNQAGSQCTDSLLLTLALLKPVHLSKVTSSRRSPSAQLTVSFKTFPVQLIHFTPLLTQ